MFLVQFVEFSKYSSPVNKMFLSINFQEIKELSKAHRLKERTHANIIFQLRFLSNMYV